ncbi:hypothetical protein B0H63DRAFT_516116 [Podospora didyma]|uniref:Protein kinase domain-containing protein n=1 Tax=Podospora didyma TaxID=330526 RepID=A0AAE0U6M6_9PEZI|nr:hypothetical protein B0H63DRAFT_516116 [Podospora didyma]
MEHFYNHGAGTITDEELPILKNSSEYGGDMMREFGTFKASNFHHYQWKFLVPVFDEVEDDESVADKAHESHTILPFRGVNNDIMPREGTFGTVFEVEVHEAHRKSSSFSGSTSNQFVKEAWEHLIQCIAAISRTDKFYFLFPWVDGGSLRDFWNSMPRPSLTPEVVRRVLVQIYGLAGALNIMHTYQGDPTTTSREAASGMKIRSRRTY